MLPATEKLTGVTKTMANNSKEPIRLRKKPISGGRSSLYLDIYIAGRRRYEFLKLYLYPETSRAAKDKNKQTLHLADAIRAKRVVDLQNNRWGFDATGKLDTNFLAYYRAVAEKRRGKKKEWNAANYGNWHACYIRLREFCREDMTFRDVTPDWVRSFREYLDADFQKWDKGATAATARQIGQNTKLEYFNKLMAAIKQAVDDKIISENPLQGVKRFKAQETNREYITLEELRRLATTECEHPNTKRAFLFSCLTGIRKSDIQCMKWQDVQQQGGFTRIIFRQKKTGAQEYLDINEQANAYMGIRGEPGDLVFGNFHYTPYTSVVLRKWALRAGIAKNLTFHSARHTFAVIMLEIGTDIYTVSKLLGHREIQGVKRNVLKGMIAID